MAEQVVDNSSPLNDYTLILTFKWYGRALQHASDIYYLICSKLHGTGMYVHLWFTKVKLLFAAWSHR